MKNQYVSERFLTKILMVSVKGLPAAVASNEHAESEVDASEGAFFFFGGDLS